MKIFYSPTSPYVRKCLVAAAETGLSVEKLPGAANPIKRDPAIVAHNPTGKVPTAIMEDGSVLFDSRVICRWIDAQNTGKKLYPEGEALWSTLQLEAMADGLTDAALLVRYETAVRPRELLWPEWLQGQMDKLTSSLDALEQNTARLDALTAGVIAVGCALGYLDLRLGNFAWRDGRPHLAQWYSGFSQRASMLATAPT